MKCLNIFMFRRAQTICSFYSCALNRQGVAAHNSQQFCYINNNIILSLPHEGSKAKRKFANLLQSQLCVVTSDTSGQVYL